MTQVFFFLKIPEGQGGECILAFDMDRVACIVAALCADDDVRLFSQNVDYFAFAFHRPIGRRRVSYWHRINKNPRT